MKKSQYMTRRIKKSDHLKYVTKYLKTHPEQYEKHKARSREYSRKNREKINRRRRYKRQREQLEDNLKRIWTIKGKIQPSTTIVE